MTNTPSPLGDLDRSIERIRRDWNNVGVAVTVVSGGEVVFSRGFGVRRLGDSAPIGPDTLFQVGSTTKPFTTTALGVLVDERKLGWDDPIVDHLPDFRLHDPWLTRNLTIRDAVAHRSGVSDHYYPYLAIKTPDQVVRHLRHLPADGAFRDSFRYNNLLYAAVGQVIERVTGSSWHEVMKQRVLAPLGMSRSGTSATEYWDPRHVAPTFYGTAVAGTGRLEDARDADVAMPHGLDERGVVQVIPWICFDSAAPAGSVVSSSAEMARWLTMHLARGQVDGRRFLEADTVRELHAPQNLRLGRDLAPLRDLEGGLGWFRAKYRGTLHLAHGGGILGFPAYLAMLPERNAGVVVLSNGPTVLGDDYKFHRAIAFLAFDRLLGQEDTDWNAELRSQVAAIAAEKERQATELERARPTDARPALPLERYCGTYEDRRIPSGRVTVALENGGLAVRFAGEGAFVGALAPWRDHQFQLRSRAPGHGIVEFSFAEFAVDPRGSVTALTIASAYFRLTLDRLVD